MVSEGREEAEREMETRDKTDGRREKMKNSQAERKRQRNIKDKASGSLSTGLHTWTNE